MTRPEPREDTSETGANYRRYGVDCCATQYQFPVPEEPHCIHPHRGSLARKEDGVKAVRGDRESSSVAISVRERAPRQMALPRKDRQC
jgi:hypothetical protein